MWSFFLATGDQLCFTKFKTNKTNQIRQANVWLLITRDVCPAFLLFSLFNLTFISLAMLHSEKYTSFALNNASVNILFIRFILSLKKLTCCRPGGEEVELLHLEGTVDWGPAVVRYSSRSPPNNSDQQFNLQWQIILIASVIWEASLLQNYWVPRKWVIWQLANP